KPWRRRYQETCLVIYNHTQFVPYHFHALHVLPFNICPVRRSEPACNAENSPSNYHSEGMFFFVIDFFVVRVPLSGLITGWLTTLPPGRYITAIYVLNFYLFYVSLYSATFLSIVRATIICFPIEGD
ncbi:hypothetical protein OSTOST_04532, partial [Ostertagia ostertagi]